MFRKILFGAVFLVAIAGAPAAAQYVTTSVSPGTVSAGGEVTVSGTACPASSEVNIYLVAGDQTATSGQGGAVPPGGVLVATSTADDDGNFTTTFTVPASTEPGTFTVVTICGDFSDAETIEVLAGSVTPTTPGTTPITNPGGGTGGTGSGGTGSGGTGSTPGVNPGALPRTGSNLNGAGLVGAGLLTAGGLFLLASRKRRTSGPAAV